MGEVASRRQERAWTRLLVALLPLGIWLAAIPYVAPGLGYVVDVPARIEVVDHVLPGVVMVAGAAGVLLWGRRSGLAVAVAASLGVLAGIWATSTHVPLLVQAGGGVVPWDAALFHSWPGPVVMAVSALLLWRALGTAR